MKKYFKYGFEYKGLLYGWEKLGGKLFRLPSVKNKRSYSFKEVPEIQIGNNIGHRTCRDPKTKQQLIDISKEINYTQLVSSHNI